MTGNGAGTPAPPLVGRAIEVAHQLGFPLTRQEAAGGGPSASLPGVGRFLAVLAAMSTGEVMKVVKDRGSGLRENRPGLNHVLTMVCDGSVTVDRVTHEDRLARFGVGWLRRLFALYGVTLEVLHPKQSGGRDEPFEDFVSLVTTIAGRLYGMRSGVARKRLLAEAGRCTEDCGA